MANKKNFFITRKALSEYLGISRPTLNRRLDFSAVDLSDFHSVLAWIQFESMGIRKATQRFNEYMWSTRGEQCEHCQKVSDLQVAHKKPKSRFPEGALLAQNANIYCVTCHNKFEEHPRIGNGKPTKITNHYVRGKRREMYVL